MERTACLECDLIVSVARLSDGQTAVCPRCDHVLSRRPGEGPMRSLAFSTAAVIFLLLANAFPFLELRSSGLENVMTLPRTALELSDNGQTVIAALVFFPIVVIPGMIALLLVGLLTMLAFGRRAVWQVPLARGLTWLSSWAMVEVFVIGVLVSLVKVTDLANVVLGVSFWAYVGFALCFTAAVSGIDRLQLWQRIEAAR